MVFNSYGNYEAIAIAMKIGIAVEQRWPNKLITKTTYSKTSDIWKQYLKRSKMLKSWQKSHAGLEVLQKCHKTCAQTCASLPTLPWKQGDG